MRRLLTPLALASLALGCANPSLQPPLQAPAPAVAATQAALLPALADNVIIPTYQDLDAKAATLDAAVQAYAKAPTDATQKAAQVAWLAARIPYEYSEAHLFGPVADLELDPAVDSWPLDQNDLDKAVASTATIDTTFVKAQQPTVKGFHAIEYLLYAKEPAKLSARELQLLSALSTDFHTNTTAMVTAWDPKGQNFRARYVTPAGSPTYGSVDVAVATTLHAMADICNEVANEKIQTPLDAKDGSLEESHYSNSSLQDFKDNVMGVERMYLGQTDGHQGLGVADLVAAKDPAVDAATRAALKQALADLAAVPGNFDEAIAQHPDALRKVQASVLAVRDAIQKNVSLAITGKISADAS